MNLVFWLAVAAVLVVLVFDYTNGFHDAANIVATMIDSRARAPAQAVVLVGVFEFLGPLLGGTAVANAINKYNIGNSTAAARTLASLGADACLRLNRAVVALADRNGGAVIIEQCHDIDRLEAQGSSTMREAVTQLFLHEGDEAAAWHALKMRRFYFTQAAVLDGCRRAAHTIDEILLENA